MYLDMHKNMWIPLGFMMGNYILDKGLGKRCMDWSTQIELLLMLGLQSVYILD